MKPGSPARWKGRNHFDLRSRRSPVLDGLWKSQARRTASISKVSRSRTVRCISVFVAPFRDGWVPVLVTTWDDPETIDVRYVQLDGRGIRDIAAVNTGFLILAGPVGDGDTSYRVYYWNGADELTGGPDAKPQRMAEFSDLGNGKPEGLAVLTAQGKTYELLIVFDGLPSGAAAQCVLSRP